ncbi:MAG: hypothetical protein JWN70_6572 [Planctomycetaceae bacterium]|nr:hypothetical protein [Planctomycetaceae bacterium]
MDTAIDAMTLGAFDYLVKPLDFAQLQQALERAFDISWLMSRVTRRDRPVHATESSDRLNGTGLASQSIYKQIGGIALQNVNVLIQGESGTGKELMARAIYQHSRRSLAPFLAIKCAGIPEELLETRGIVLLLLYLVIDAQDRRPLIIDQPEENLDPKSVFEELVPHFRNARKRRQVIIVTHNANLVVNTDADQVIVAFSEPNPAGGLPTVTYRCGSLENSKIRKTVCEILEGGEQAFRDRERRYRLQRTFEPDQ